MKKQKIKYAKIIEYKPPQGGGGGGGGPQPPPEPEPENVETFSDDEKDKQNGNDQEQEGDEQDQKGKGGKSGKGRKDENDLDEDNEDFEGSAEDEDGESEGDDFGDNKQKGKGGQEEDDDDDDLTEKTGNGEHDLDDETQKELNDLDDSTPKTYQDTDGGEEGGEEGGYPGNPVDFIEAENFKRQHENSGKRGIGKSSFYDKVKKIDASNSNVAWRTLLRNFFGTKLIRELDPGKMKIRDAVSMRQINPGYTIHENQNPEILVLVDTSGSVSENSLRTFMCEIVNIAFKSKKTPLLRILFFDDIVNQDLTIDVLKTKQDEMLRIMNNLQTTRDGTTIQCVKKYLEDPEKNKKNYKQDKNKKYEGLIIFTDGCLGDDLRMDQLPKHKNMLNFIIQDKKGYNCLNPLKKLNPSNTHLLPFIIK